MTELDSNVIYEKLEVLAVRQAEMLTQMEADSRANWQEHSQIRDRMDVANGNVADVRQDFDQKVIDDSQKEIATEAVIKTVKRGVAAVLVTVTMLAGVVPTAFMIVDKLGVF